MGVKTRIGMPRHYSRRMGRGSGMRPVIQSYKKVINHAPASHTAGTNISFNLTSGIDSVAAGQTSVTDVGVPTGAVIKYIEIQFAAGNSTATPLFLHIAIEQLLSGQALVPPNAVGGNPLRNQVFHQALYQIGERESFNRTFKFKIPKQFQRVREGTSWRLITTGDVVWNSAVQVIYKFYR